MRNGVLGEPYNPSVCYNLQTQTEEEKGSLLNGAERQGLALGSPAKAQAASVRAP